MCFDKNLVPPVDTNIAIRKSPEVELSCGYPGTMYTFSTVVSRLVKRIKNKCKLRYTSTSSLSSPVARAMNQASAEAASREKRAIPSFTILFSIILPSICERDLRNKVRLFAF